MVAPGDLMDMMETITVLVERGFSAEYLESVPPYELEILVATILKLNEDKKAQSKQRFDLM